MILSMVYTSYYALDRVGSALHGADLARPSHRSMSGTMMAVPQATQAGAVVPKAARVSGDPKDALAASLEMIQMALNHPMPLHRVMVAPGRHPSLNHQVSQIHLMMAGRAAEGWVVNYSNGVRRR